MSIYLHQTAVVRDEPTARYGGGRQEFVIIELDDYSSLSVHSPTEADALIKAAAEAKQLLLAAQDAPVCDCQADAPATADDGPDCGCGLGAARCRDLEDGA